jgi:hypothetical protein
VWDEPIQKIANRYGISNVGLAKICKRYAIPMPGRGYWQKLKAGKKVQQILLKPFPRWKEGSDRVVLEYRTTTVENPLPVPTAVTNQQIHEQDQSHTIVVASTLAAAGKLHPLVKRTQASITKRMNDHASLAMPQGESVLDIRVTSALVDRACLIMDALIKALDQRGYPVQSRIPRPVWHRHRGFTAVTSWPSRVSGLMTCVQVGDQDVLLMLREQQKQIKRPPVPPEDRRYSWDTGPVQQLIGSGRLVLSIPHHVGGWGQWATWADTDRVKLETRLNDVVIGVVAAAEEFRAVVSRWQQEEHAERVAALRRAELERQKNIEIAKAKEIERQATAWSLARTIREYVTAARTKTDVDNSSTIAPEGMDEAAWLEWAQEYADRIDPLS